MNVLFDSNILLRATDPSSAQHTAALQSVKHLSAAGHTLCLCSQNLYEFWAVATRPTTVNGLGLATAAVRDAVDDFLRTYPLLPDPVHLAVLWLDLVTRHGVSGKETHDTRLVALMIAHGVTHLLTFNGADFARYAEVTALNPNDPAAFPSP